LGHKDLCKFLLPAVTATLFSVSATAQTSVFGPAPFAPNSETTDSFKLAPRFDVTNLPPGMFGTDGGGSAAQQGEQSEGVVKRSVKRTLDDQKQMYIAPFKPSNLRWDALVLAPTALFLATDRHIENNLPGGHYQFYQDASNIAIGGLAATLAGVWIYGLKGDHPHARETGFLELETLVDTFLIYTPMQLIAARQRPGEGNGHGDFWKHHAINTSFPGGHAMFTWAMATVVAQEYPKPWVQVLTYTAAFTVTTTRFLARDHWASDMWLGAALGVAIGTHVFHAHCDPELSASCKRHHEKMLKRKMKLSSSPLYSWPNAKPTEDYASGRPISQ
jgi:membrane-associated phospholipid phosphatase